MNSSTILLVNFEGSARRDCGRINHWLQALGTFSVTPSNPDERRSTRTNVLLSAVVEVEGANIPVRVRNLSAHGVLVKASGLAAGDTRIVFRCNGVAIPGWIVWADENDAGIQFGEAVQPDRVVKKPPASATSIVQDTRSVNFRRPGFRGNLLTDEQREIIQEWMRGGQ